MMTSWHGGPQFSEHPISKSDHRLVPLKKKGPLLGIPCFVKCQSADPNATHSAWLLVSAPRKNIAQLVSSGQIGLNINAHVEHLWTPRPVKCSWRSRFYGGLAPMCFASIFTWDWYTGWS
jgi:hypothetical protein